MLSILMFVFMMVSMATVETEEKCLTDYPEVIPKKYVHWEGQSLDIVVETSERITHQLSTWVFYYFAKEVLGYSRVRVETQPDYFVIDPPIQRLIDQKHPIAKSTINLEVWIPPDYDTYVTEYVKECGSVSPPGRFGWFIPVNLTAPILSYYNPSNFPDVRSVPWRHFRNPDFVKHFDISQEDLKFIDRNYAMTINGTTHYSCTHPDCVHNLFTPEQCKNQKYKCATLLAAHYNATKFVINHIRESQLLVRVLFVDNHLVKVVSMLKRNYRTQTDKSLVVLTWVPSDVVLYESDFVTVTFENSERLNFTQSTGYKYDMHRLVKVAWVKVETLAWPLYEGLRSFKFTTPQYTQLLSLYQTFHANQTYQEIACKWMRANRNTWESWRPSAPNVIFIGGIFPMSGSSYSGQGIYKGAKMAVEAVNSNTSVLANYKLDLLLTDGKCRADNVMRNFIDFIVNVAYYDNLVGVLGPACSDTVEPLAGVSKYYRTVSISYSAEGSSFSNREKYPYFFRTIGENKHYKHVYLELFKAMKWKRVAALTEDGQKYTEYISLMQDELEQNGITFIANKKFPRERETEPMTRYLEDLREKRARIIIADVVDEIARQVMCEAYKLNMTGHQGYVWFLPMWLNRTFYNTDYFNSEHNENVNCTTHEMIQAIAGYFSISHAYFADDNQIMQENKTVAEWRRAYMNRLGPFSNYSGFAYDAVWVYALALDKLARIDSEALSDLHSENTTRKLVDLIEQTDFLGVSGRIKFRGGPSRFSVINIWEWYDNSTHRIGQFYPNLTDNAPEILGGNLSLDTAAIRWFTSNREVPDDGTPPLPICALDSIAKLFNVECQTAFIILNILGISVLLIAMFVVCIHFRRKYNQKMKKQHEYMLLLKSLPEGTQYTNLEQLEIPRDCIELNRRLGNGAFGTVYGGEITTSKMPVAVKTLKWGSSIEDKIDFLTEADNMKRFDHKNIVKLLGVVTKTEPLHTLMEFCLYGDLKTYLLARRHIVSQKGDNDSEVSPKRLTNMALDISRGLSYLAKLKYVHRDLACRNCLVDSDRNIKIGDFGLTRPVNDYECYRFKRKGMLPVRWMAPESLLSGVYTPASDVWSYGVVLYEMVTFGCTPWYGSENKQVVELVRGGTCLEVPKGVKPQLEALMKSCWSWDPKQRPMASSIVELLATNPKLLSACMDVPLQSITVEEMTESIRPDRAGVPLDKIDFRKNLGEFLNSPKVLMEPNQMSVDFEVMTLPPLAVGEEDSSVSIPLENYCPKAPLLGVSKSTSSLMNFGKFQTQNNSRDSRCQDEDEGFIGNSPSSNGYINSKL